MRRPLGIRVAPAIYITVAVLLSALAVVQYRWSSRVSAADAQREREHLNTAASLFTAEFNDVALRALQYIQNDAQSALKSETRLAPPPKIIGELYYIESNEKGAPQAKRLNADGFFAPSAVPEWLPASRCSALVLDKPLAFVSPMFELSTLAKTGPNAFRIMRSLRNDKCLIGRLDERYLRETFFPDLLKKSFGDTSWAEYNFAVVPRDGSAAPLYGAPLKADIEKPFFSLAAIHIPTPRTPPQTPPEKGKMIFVQRFESTTVTTGPAPNRFVFGDGMWQLQIAHKGISLADSFERTRRLDLFLSISVELLLGVAIVVLVIGVRRMQRLAEQKMEFVAAVSHELRAPVSAISMLSRNQADGLVSGNDKVQQYGELIHQQSRRLNEMVEQTLQYAGIHSNLGRPPRTEIDLKRLINETVNSRREELVRRGFEVEVDTTADLPPIHGDPNLLRIAIDNLLSNAEKYADGGRWIRVRAEYVASAREILIGVEDRGPGIATADQEEIFEPFSRGQAAIDAQIPGSGIGLSLVRSAAEAHRGTVTLVSEPGRGSTFTLHLPV